MKSKLLNKNAYEAICRNCRHGRLSPEGDKVLCVKKGIVDPDGSCRRYSYDPLKRVPRKMPAVREANPEDFDLSIGIDLPEKPRNEIPAAVEETSDEAEEETPEVAEELTEIIKDVSDETEEAESPADEADKADEGVDGHWSKTSIFDIGDEMESDL